MLCNANPKNKKETKHQKKNVHKEYRDEAQEPRITPIT